MAFDSIKDLRLFVRIYEHGGITAAADLFGMTPAVASKRLKNLEAQAGEALFHRSTRHLSPTGAGTDLYHSARSIIALADEAEAQLEGGSEPSGLLRITTSIAFGRLYLADIVSEFLKQNRKVQIETLFTDKMLDLVDDGIDVAFRISAPVNNSPMIMRRLASGKRILCATRNYLHAKGYPDHPQSLKEHNCIVLNRYSVWKLEKQNQIETVRVSGNYHSNDGEAVLQAVRNDLGIGVVALWHGASDISAGTLRRVLPEYELTGQPDIFAIYHPSQRYVTRLRRFIEFVEERLRLPFSDPDDFLARHTT